MEHSYNHNGYSATHTAATSATATPMRPSTPSESSYDHITPMPKGQGPGTNPFSSPWASGRASVNASSSALNIHQQAQQQKYFHSRRVKKGEIERPWLDRKDPREKWVTIIPLIGLALGFAFAGFLIYDGMKTVVKHDYCSILDDDFSGGFNTDVWTKESEVGGFGNGQFEQTTTTDENVFIQDGKLHIKPTLQDENLINTNTIIDLTKPPLTCSSDVWANCHAVTNTTNGTIIPPVKSGRISTKKSKTIKYGRVEVTAVLPEGDWMWPAIWMLPAENKYGDWPKSGEIDIAESRGNNYTFAQGGNNIVSSALHWGPNEANDAWWRTNVKRNALHTTFTKKEHKFGMEWSEKYIFTYIDTRLLQVLYTNFDQSLWERGQFPLSDSNGTRLTDPWSQTGNKATPFDQPFYLILNVAVGSTNGWFKDGASGKPWVDQSLTARKDFWDARAQWHPTWEKHGEMIVSSVKMWSEGAC
ncbi:MAG: hypothetical protein Q9212_002969 [Teloschistes hypoglaucus]